MGRCEINLDEFVDGKRHRRWQPLLDKKGRKDKQRGDVEVVIRWVHEPRLRRFVDDDKGEGPANELCVCVVQAMNLLAMDGSGMLGLGKAKKGVARVAKPVGVFKQAVAEEEALLSASWFGGKLDADGNFVPTGRGHAPRACATARGPGRGPRPRRGPGAAKILAQRAKKPGGREGFAPYAA